MMASILTVIFALTLGTVPALACHTGSLCTTDQGAHGYCIHGACVDHIPSEVRDHLRFKIIVKYPEPELRAHGLPEMMYIAGIGRAFSMLSGVPMMRTQNDTWETEVRYTSSMEGFKCQMCTDMTPLQHNRLEFRIFLDNGVDMKGGNFVVDFPLSSVSTYFDDAPEMYVYPWFFSDNGIVSSFDIRSTHIEGERNTCIAVYTPPSFKENTYKKYPVFIALDLAYDIAHNIRYVFDDPIKLGVASEYVVVGFGDYNGSRTDLLTPSTGNMWSCRHGNDDNNCDGCRPDTSNMTAKEYYDIMRDKCGKVETVGGLGDSTLDFLTIDVLREAQTTCGNRLSLDRDNVGIIGYSLGGLIACHAAWTRPHVFGLAACQSPSLWWPRHIDHAGNISNQFEFLNQTLKNPILWQNRPRQKIYIDAGDKESAYMATGAVEAAAVMNTHDLFTMNENLWVNIFTGDPHNTIQWVMRVWKSVSTLLPMPGRPHKQDGSGQSSDRPASSGVPAIPTGIPLTSSGVVTRPDGIPVIPDIHVPNIIG